MSDTQQKNEKFLEAFPTWLKSLAADVSGLSLLVADQNAPEGVRVTLASGLNYLIKAVDLVADGIEDLGYLDDAFVLRVAAQQARAQHTDFEGPSEFQRLANEAETVAEFLGEDFQHLVDYVARLAETPVRGHSAAQIVGDAGLVATFTRELKTWTDALVAPSFARDEKNLVKLRAFLRTKLGRT